MRRCFQYLTALFLTPWLALAQEAGDSKLANRYGYEANLRGFPQKTPQDTLKSLVKALNEDRFDYMMAHLVDPAYVDPKVAQFSSNFPQATAKGRILLAFRQMVKETSAYFRDDPVLLKELRLFNKEAEWEVEDERAVGTLKKLGGRHVVFKRYEDRWFLENRQSK